MGEKLGRYEIRSKLGSGGMGEVYEAHDSLLDRAVAIKLLSSEFSADKVWKARFYREARAASSLNHPHILTIYEIGETEHGTFLATELVYGETLREVIKRRAASTAQILKIAEQITSALSAAHEANIVHRDVKPENVMVRRDGYVKVLDFGLAKQIVADNTDDDSNVKTMAGMILGSVRYMSPEQARAQKVDARTDIWSFGAVLYEMLAAKGPFDKQTTSETLGAIIYQQPDRIADRNPNVPPEVQSIIARCLEKNPDARYQTMAEVGHEIRDVLYALEHAASAERGRYASGDIAGHLSENPTIIHQSTTSDRHRAAATVRSREAAAARPWWRNPWTISAGVAIALLVVGRLMVYAVFHRSRDAMVNKFEKTTVARLDSDGKAVLPVISPDGKYVAYAKGEAGNRSLVVRQLATNSEVTVVPPTAQNFVTVTFSPSSDYVLYTLTTKDYNLNNLYRVPALGGEPKELVRDVDSVPTFSPDGKRLAFMRHAGDKGTDIIFTAAADGSNLTEIFNRQQTDYSFLTQPAWSPQGDTILIGGGKAQGGVTTGVVILEIKPAGGGFKVFNPRTWKNFDSMVWLRDGSGFLLVARENDSATNQIWRISYPDGVAQPITNDLNDYTGISVSADGAALLTAKSETVSSLWTYAPQEKAATQLSADSPTLDGANGLSLTPDGHLLFSRREGKFVDIWVADSDDKNPRRLTSDSRSNFSPLMTPDGRYIIFNSNRSGTYRIWRMDADGRNAVQLTAEDVNNSDFNPIVAPDGQHVVFNRNYVGDSQPSEILSVSIIDKSPGSVLRVPQHSVFLPQISPDGKRLMYTSYAVESIIRTVYVAAFDGSVAGAVEKSAPYSLMNIMKWSPDGKTFTYVNAEGIQNIWQMSPDGTQKQPITDFKSGRIFNYTWGANGKTIFIVRAIVNSDLVLIRDAGSSPTP